MILTFLFLRGRDVGLIPLPKLTEMGIWINHGTQPNEFVDVNILVIAEAMAGKTIKISEKSILHCVQVGHDTLCK